MQAFDVVVNIFTTTDFKIVNALCRDILMS